ncbi:50S ribosomal protein L15 [Geodia barretti]|uniref:Large ribosomal subunit protein uL15m n=1 Tax=Geodia barretti TaxID=519541 RepID=A0AA35R109_GEOBA|nr:50S ribosomal protein L15 [Geodia barretti]
MPGLHQLRPADRSRRKRKRVGRGDGSGSGSYSGRGSKGQLQTGKVPFLFEGGQLRLVKRLPFMRGFTNKFRVEYSPVNVASLNMFENGSQIGPDELVANRIVRNTGVNIKLLGDGEIGGSVHLTVHACSASARAKIEAAGGSITLIGGASASEDSTSDE